MIARILTLIVSSLSLLGLLFLKKENCFLKFISNFKLFLRVVSHPLLEVT